MTNRKPWLRPLAIAVVTITTLAVAGTAQGQVVWPYPGQTGTGTLTAANAKTPLLPAGQPTFVYELPQPIFYTPDTTTYPGFDYYEIQVADVTQLPLAFPQPPTAPPAGRQWLGLCTTWNAAAGTCTGPLYTPVQGYGQINQPAYPLNGKTTYPSMSFKATRNKPVKVKFINNLPNNHLFCPAPQNADIPCAIDRSLMGLIAGTGVTPYGSPQQPDNAVVIHLHGGEIPPDSDGFAELWFGNTTTAGYYQTNFPSAPATTLNAYQNISPSFDATLAVGNGILGPSTNGTVVLPTPPTTLFTQYTGTFNGNSTPTGDLGPGPAATGGNSVGNLVRPTGNSMIYNYPMVQDPATIWYHDHALGKTRINVVAGPAGYFYVTDPAVEGGIGLPNLGVCDNASVLAGTCYDVPIVLQDRSFNTDGTINYPNGLAYVTPPPKTAAWNGLTPGPNPTFHPQWVPEYFGDFAVINGVIWPKISVEPRPYRFRLLDGSNARCYTLGMVNAAGATKKAPAAPLFQVIASDQGYLPAAAALPNLTMCPGERFDVIIDFSNLAGQKFTVTNTAGAPFPGGPTPQQGGSPYAALGQLLQFQVAATCKGTCPGAWNAAGFGAPPATKARLATMVPANANPARPVGTDCTWNAATSTVGLGCQMILNEVLHPVTKAPLRVQIDGKPFEAAVTEIPKRRTTEVWQIINTTVDVHPMHLHLVQFKVVQRQKFNATNYNKAVGLPPVNWQANPLLLTKVSVAPYLMGKPVLPPPEEAGFKDTAKSYPGEVLTVIAKWDGGWCDGSTDPVNQANCLAGGNFVYQPVTAGPYVWHCHIVDHEDNEMMRPSLVMP
jgi:FtsP/CotA-like multicopper oxidase with cupredoxin domain